VTSDANPETTSAAAGRAALADLPPPGRRALGLFLLWAIFAVSAFGPLVTFDPEPTLAAEFEGAFFTPSDTSPSVVLLLSAWLIYRRRERLLRLPLPSGTPWLGLALLSLSAGILAWAKFVGAGDLRVPALMAAVMGTGALFGGARAARVLVLPAFLLLFAMPAPAPLLNAVLLRMQFMTADFAGALLHAVGASAFVTGDLILREGNSFAIIETCSGVRITETLTMLTILMLDLFRRRPLHSVILLALAPVVAFFCNGIRAVTLILNPHSDISEIHTLQGIGMLLGGLLFLYGIDGVLGKLLPVAAEAASTERIPAAAAASGEPDKILSRARGRGRLAVASLAVLAAGALAVPQWSDPTETPGEVPYNVPFADEQMSEIGPWTSVKVPVDRRFNGRIGLQRDVSRRYLKGREAVLLYAAGGERSFRARSVLFSKAELPGSGWNTFEQGVLRWEQDGTEATWRVAVSGTRRYLVVSWQENATGLWEESLRSLLGLDQSPFRRSGEAVIVRLATNMVGTEASNRKAAEDRLRRFYADLRPKLDAQHAIFRGDTI